MQDKIMDKNIPNEKKGFNMLSEDVQKEIVLLVKLFVAEGMRN